MTTAEFNSEFDILYNNIMNNQAPGLDEYEKSVFLTRAQEEILKNYFQANSAGNLLRQGFDNNQRRPVQWLNLYENINLDVVNAPDVLISGKTNSKAFIYKEDILFPISEYVTVNRNNKETRLVAVTLNHLEYDRLSSKPYSRPLVYQAWKLIVKDNLVEIVVSPGDTIIDYNVRYIRKPRPIILTDLRDWNISIGGLQDITECELDSSMHQDVLQRAVELAKASYIEGTIEGSMAIGKRSE